jgi:hypothetical protein
MAKKPVQRSLDKWTKQKWRTPSGKPSLETGEVYAPSASIAKMKATKEGRERLAQATEEKKEALSKGEQFSRHGLHKGKEYAKFASTIKVRASKRKGRIVKAHTRRAKKK